MRSWQLISNTVAGTLLVARMPSFASGLGSFRNLSQGNSYVVGFGTGKNMVSMWNSLGYVKSIQAELNCYEKRGVGFH